MIIFIIVVWTIDFRVLFFHPNLAKIVICFVYNKWVWTFVIQQKAIRRNAITFGKFDHIADDQLSYGDLERLLSEHIDGVSMELILNFICILLLFVVTNGLDPTVKEDAPIDRESPKIVRDPTENGD